MGLTNCRSEEHCLTENSRIADTIAKLGHGYDSLVLGHSFPSSIIATVKRYKKIKLGLVGQNSIMI